VKHITLGLLAVLGVISPSYAGSVTPNFTSGTITSETKTHTEVIETIKQIEYSTGTSYTVTGTNINIPGTPAPGMNYTIQTQGAPFQFSETYLTPGVAKETWIDRKTTEDSVTNSISVFTQ
jgi:hypothetical protein